MWIVASSAPPPSRRAVSSTIVLPGGSGLAGGSTGNGDAAIAAHSFSVASGVSRAVADLATVPRWLRYWTWPSPDTSSSSRPHGELGAAGLPIRRATRLVGGAVLVA